MRKKFIPKGREFYTKHQLALQIALEISKITQRNCTFVVDGAYAAKEFILPLMEGNHTVISRLNCRARLHETVVKQKKGRGRPRKYGKKLSPLDQMVKQKNQFKEYSAIIYGKNQKLRIRSFVAVWRAIGKPIKVVIVIGPGEKPTYIFSTDLELEELRIVELFAARWKIEITFRELKQNLGLQDCQGRNEKFQQRHLQLCCMAHSLTSLWGRFINPVQVKNLKPWYTRKNEPSFNDLVAEISHEYYSQRFFSFGKLNQIDKKIPTQLENIIRKEIIMD